MSDLVMKRLSAQTLEDFLDYFDHRAFLDNSQWSGCYCQFYLGTADEDIPLELNQVILDLGERGFEAVEAAPVTEVVAGRIPYRGTLKMFLNQGFDRVLDFPDNHTLVRRYLT